MKTEHNTIWADKPFKLIQPSRRPIFQHLMQPLSQRGINGYYRLAKGYSEQAKFYNEFHTIYQVAKSGIGRFPTNWLHILENMSNQ